MKTQNKNNSKGNNINPNKTNLQTQEDCGKIRFDTGC